MVVMLVVNWGVFVVVVQLGVCVGYMCDVEDVTSEGRGRQEDIS